MLCEINTHFVCSYKHYTAINVDDVAKSGENLFVAVVGSFSIETCFFRDKLCRTDERQVQEPFNLPEFCCDYHASTPGRFKRRNIACSLCTHWSTAAVGLLLSESVIRAGDNTSAAIGRKLDAFLMYIWYCSFLAVRRILRIGMQPFSQRKLCTVK